MTESISSEQVVSVDDLGPRRLEYASPDNVKQVYVGVEDILVKCEQVVLLVV